MKKSGTYYFILIGIFGIVLAQVFNKLLHEASTIWMKARMEIPTPTQAYQDTPLRYWPYLFILIAIAAVILALSSRVQNKMLVRGALCTFIIMLLASVLATITIMLPSFNL